MVHRETGGDGLDELAECDSRPERVVVKEMQPSNVAWFRSISPWHALILGRSLRTGRGEGRGFFDVAMNDVCPAAAYYTLNTSTYISATSHAVSHPVNLSDLT